MARILYGVHGTGRGHAIRALTVARHYSTHDFLFVCHGEAARLLGAQFRVLECPNPVTPVAAHRVDAVGALLGTVRTLLARAHWSRAVRRAAEEFKPDIAVTDYEFFVPRVARELGLPSLSLDNQHAITLGAIAVPPAQVPSWAATSLAVRLLFSAADQYLISCFFAAPSPAAGRRVDWVAPLLRNELVSRRAEPGDHVLAYQGYPTFAQFADVLARLGRPVRLYGMGGGTDRGHVSFRDFDEQSFVDDLASCAYVICGGGHTLISEALHLGKPVLSIPVRGAFEQFLNAFYVERCGYGARASAASFSPDGVAAFEAQLDRYRQRIRANNFCGNAAAFAVIDGFIAGRRQSPDHAPRPAA